MHNINELKNEIFQLLENATKDEVESLKIKYLGRKGILPSIL
ncbi:phenylalanine--tRNA ligase subunit alpha, partial [candidate division TA06 bacterium]